MISCEMFFMNKCYFNKITNSFQNSENYWNDFNSKFEFTHKFQYSQ
jgi:hypothetical protein